MRRFLKILVWSVAGIVVLAMAAVAFLHTAPGGRLIASVANSALSGPDMTVELSPPKLGWGGDLRLDSVRVSDSEGPWLQVTGIDAKWHPLALLGGRLSIDSIGIAGVAVDRKPRPATSETEKETSSASVPALPIDITLGKLQVREISLGSDIAGTPVRLTADGSFAFDAATMSLAANANIRRDDDKAGNLTATVGYLPETQSFKLDFSASEPRGGLLARLLDVSELPALDVSLKGDGPLQNWAADLAIALDGVQTVTGKAGLTETTTNGAVTRHLDFDLSGQLEPLTPEAVRPLFAGAAQAKGTVAFDRDFKPLNLRVNAETAAFALSADGWETPETLSANVSARLKTPVSLTFDGDTLSASELTLTAKASGKPENADWSAEIDGRNLASRHGTMASLSLDARGQEANLVMETLKVPATLDLVADISSVSDPRFEAFTGSTRATAELIAGAGNWVDVRALAINNPALQASLTGLFAPEEANADAKLMLGDIAALSALAGRDLSGSLSAGFKVQAVPEDGSATVKIDGTGMDLALGDPRADKLLQGRSSLTGSLSRDKDGTLSADDLHLVATGLDLTITGTSDLKDIEATTTAALADLALIDPALTGSANLEASANGPIEAPKVTAHLTARQLTMQGEPVKELTVSADLTASLTKPAGTIDIGATFRDQPLTGHAGFSSDETGTRRIEDIQLTTGQSRITGALALDGDGKPSGSLAITLPDLAEIAPLLLQKLAGALDATIDFSSESGVPVARVSATGRKIVSDAATLGQADLKATIADFLNTPHIGGTLTASNIVAGGTTVEQLTAKASGTADGTDFETDALLDGGKLSLAGQVAQMPDGIAVTLNKAKGVYQGQETSLASPARVVLPNDGPITLDKVTLLLGSGKATVAGTVGDKLDIKVGLEKVPAELVDLAAPGMRFGGTITGKVDVSGTTAAPVAAWSMAWNGLETSALSGFGLPNADLKSDGRFANSAVTHKSILSVGADGRLTAEGSVQIAGSKAMNMSVTGNLPFALAQRALTQSGLRLDGAAAVDLKIGGTTAKPAFSGQVTTRDATAVSLNTGLVVKSIETTAKIDTTRIEITSLTGTIGAGGTLSASGSIGLGGSLPANLNLKINDGTYTDGRIVTAKLTADLTLSGDLAVMPKIGGSILIQRADVTIPSSLATTLAPVDVKHINAPRDVARQTASLTADNGSKSSGGGVALDLDVNAPGQIFVRGRGLQVELGGRIRISGTSANPVTTGAFTLKNGTLSILSRLLTLTKGRITFLGSFDPLLDFAATTTASSTTITVGIEGNASNPDVSFTSSPAYPQEEVLALLLFGQNLSSLSAAQVAQLAGAVATLGGASPLENLRKSLGVDSINITTDEDNNTTAEVSKRLGEKVSVGVQQGTQEGSSRVTIDIDVTKHLRARGEAGADGSSKAGIFFEKEY